MHITEEPYFYGFDSEAVLHRDAKVAEFGLLSGHLNPEDNSSQRNQTCTYSESLADVLWNLD